MNPVLEKYWNVPGYIILYLSLMIALGIFIYRGTRLYALLSHGAEENRGDNFVKRAMLFLAWVLGEWCTLRSVSRKDQSGIGHFILFWTFIVFFINYLYLFSWGAWHNNTSLLTLDNVFSSVFCFVLEFLSFLTIGVVVWALCRRYIVRPDRLETTLEPAIILILVFLLIITYFVGEALRISIVRVDSGGIISSTFAVAFDGINESTRRTSYEIVWWFHVFIFLGFLVYIPYSKHLHIIVGPFNLFFRSLRPKGALIPINIETANTLGVEKIEEFTWKQLLDLYACAECGRCQVNCPAYLSGKTLSPQQMIKSLKNHLIGKGVMAQNKSKDLIGEIISEDKIWDCLTCYACQEVCPVRNEHVDKIIELRRNLTLVKNRAPETVERALRMMMMRGDPYTGTQHLRTDWTYGLEVKRLSEGNKTDILYWVGCAGALDERNMKVTISIAKLLKQAGINFGVLGAEESCCGDPARRIGQELMFQTQVQRNIETFSRYHVKKIITSCPHGYNTFKNEYPQFGGNFEVFHHTEFIIELIRKGNLKPTKRVYGRVTYHDPCYLGRYNDVYKAPRAILSSIPMIKFIELEKSGRGSFCCGGGGGHMWLEENTGKRINVMRTEDIIEAKADIVVTACPFCIQMLEEGVKRKHLQGSIEILDISELVERVI